MNNDFILYRTKHQLLSSLVDYFFYTDTSTDALIYYQETIIPYPRATLGYFFNHPFLVSQKNNSQSVNLIISRTNKIPVTVQPQSARIKIIGVHLKPYALAALTQQTIAELPIIINVEDLFQYNVSTFLNKVNQDIDIKTMFQALEQLLLANLHPQDLTQITKMVTLIEEKLGNIKVIDLAKTLDITTRTIRNYFLKYIGCSPKDYIELVKLKQAVYQLHFSDYNLTNISYSSNYFDQAHFIKTLKRLTGKAPKHLQAQMPHFRFLQF